MAVARIKIKLTKVRLGFPSLFVPRSQRNEDGSMSSPKFGAVLGLKPNDPQVALIRTTMQQVAELAWPGAGAKQYKALGMDNRLCLIDGDSKPDTDGFPGNMIFRASSKTRPMVVDSDERTPLVQSDGRPYGGCYVNASVDVWAQDNKFGKRLNGGLVAIMFHSHGEPFGGGSIASENEFEGMGSAEEENEFA